MLFIELAVTRNVPVKAQKTPCFPNYFVSPGRKKCIVCIFVFKKCLCVWLSYGVSEELTTTNEPWADGKWRSRQDTRSLKI